MKNLSKAEILALVEEVKKDLKTIGEKEVERLLKADPLPPEGSSSSSSSSSSPSASLEGSSSSASAPPEGSAPVDGMPPGGAPPPGAPLAGPEGSAPPPGPEGVPPGGEAGGAPSQEELVQLYSALAQSSPEDFQAHVQAIQQVIQMVGGGAEGSAPPPGPEGAAPPPPGAGPPAPPGAPPMAPPGAPGEEQLPPDLATKSEVEDLKTALKKAEETIDLLGQAVQGMAVPKRKAVTGINFIPYQASAPDEKPMKKSFGDMTPAEARAAIKDIVASDKLTKSDRETINGVLLNPTQYPV